MTDELFSLRPDVCFLPDIKNSRHRNVFQLADCEHILSNKVYDASHDRNIVSVYLL